MTEETKRVVIDPFTGQPRIVVEKKETVVERRGGGGSSGVPGPEGPQGPAGADGAQGAQGNPGPGVAANGTSGQLLAKASNADYDTEWIDPTTGGVVSVVPGNNIDVDATDPANPIVSVETLTLADISDVTASASELNTLDGITASTTELNYTDGVTSGIQTQLDAKIPKSLVDAKGDIVVASADDTPARLAVGTDGKFLKANSAQATGLEWATVSASPAGSDTQLQYNNSGAFGADADLYWLSAYNVLRAANGGMQVSPGHTTFGYGDIDGNGKVTFDGNAVRLYGYSAIELADGSGKFSDISRSRISHGTQSINTTPIGGGNMDYGLQFGEYVTAYAGKGIGAGYVPRVDASANNDLLIGSYFTANLQHGSYTGVAKVNAYFISLTADSVGSVFQAHGSQSVDLTQWRDSSMAVIAAVKKNGAIQPASLADSAAANSTIYYSTDASKLVFKDSGGSVNALY